MSGGESTRSRDVSRVGYVMNTLWHRGSNVHLVDNLSITKQLVLLEGSPRVDTSS